MVKICAVSDLHGNLPDDIPACDILLIAGDICHNYCPGAPLEPALQEKWLRTKWADWLKKQPANHILATFGNHDFVTHGQGIYIDELVVAKGLRIWFSPWSNLYNDWAWMKRPDELATYYAAIPEGTDIIVSHGPPYGYGDAVDPRFWTRHNEDPHLGSKELVTAIDRVKPSVVVCGHIHSGHGEYQHNRTRIYNVSLVDEAYKPVYGVTQFEVEDR